MMMMMVMDENMSNLTSASGEATFSSGTQPVKKKRNLPGNPDPDAEVIALSPKALMARNRFVCEICSKGFQRDQNLQLHRRGHNLPWKLKQRTNKEVRKKVYVCPEEGCVHHDPARALGDLTGIKKHFCRKHGEKKWKCEKCSKRYAVQSDWKAHSKTCGTREYRCDCGTLFSRRDSFITHRAFCDALAEESSRSFTGNPLLISSAGASITHINNLHLQQSHPQFMNNSHDLHHAFSMKKEQENFSTTTTLIRPENIDNNNNIPPWLACQAPPPIDLTSSSVYSTRLDGQDQFTILHHENTDLNPNPSLGGPILPPYPHPHPFTPSSPHMSATALLQKAAQMGATMSTTKTCSSSPAMVRPHHAHVSANSGTTATNNNNNNTTGFGLNLSSRDQNLAAFGNKAGSSLTDRESGGGAGAGAGAPPSFLQEMMASLSSATTGGFDHGSTFEDAFRCSILDSKTMTRHHGNGNGNDDGMTRDFLGLSAPSQSDILSIAGTFGSCMNTTSQDHQSHNHESWQG